MRNLNKKSGSRNTKEKGIEPLFLVLETNILPIKLLFQDISKIIILYNIVTYINCNVRRKTNLVGTEKRQK